MNIYVKLQKFIVVYVVDTKFDQQNIHSNFFKNFDKQSLKKWFTISQNTIIFSVNNVKFYEFENQWLKKINAITKKKTQKMQN